MYIRTFITLRHCYICYDYIIRYCLKIFKKNIESANRNKRIKNNELCTLHFPKHTFLYMYIYTHAIILSAVQTFNIDCKGMCVVFAADVNAIVSYHDIEKDGSHNSESKYII
jgi:hypothetical protein